MSNFKLVKSSGAVVISGAAIAVQAVNPFVGHANGWNSVTGDNGYYSLDDTWLAVFGDHATVIFASVGDQVSFNGPSSSYYDETVNSSGGGGAIIVVHAHVTLSGQDNVIFFDPSNDVLNLSSAANGWNTLYASSGTVNLNGASLNVLGVTSRTVVGNVITINSVSGVNAVSLYGNEGNAYLVNGDEVTVTLTNATAAIHGSGDWIWLVGGSASHVVLDLNAGQFDTVYGAGTVSLQGGAVVSVGGGALVDFLAAGGVAYLSYTQGIWDQVRGAAGTVALHDAQASVFGGGQRVEFSGGDDDAASLYQTGGNWDFVYGNAKTLAINGAQASVFGAVGDIYLDGAGAEVSIYDTYSYSYLATRVHAENGVAIVRNSRVEVIGGDDKVYLDASGFADVTISATDGRWDNVYEQNQFLTLNGAQTSVFGGGNTILAFAGNDALSLYDTGANADVVEGGGAVTLNDATALLIGSNFYVYFSAGANSATLANYHDDDLLTFEGGFGRDTISNFQSTDVIALSKTEFADFHAFQAALTQQGDDSVLTLDANDTATFVGVQTFAITAAQVRFV